MSTYFFDLGQGHLSAKVRKAAERAGGQAINYTEPNGTKRHWFQVPNLGVPLDEIRANKVRMAVSKVKDKENTL